MNKDHLLLEGVNGEKDRDSTEDIRMDKDQQNYLVRTFSLKMSLKIKLIFLKL